MDKKRLLFEKLRLSDINCGYSYQAEAKGNNELRIKSYNPTDGTLLAEVTSAGDHEYKQVCANAHRAFMKWRDTPAPVRGQLIRDLGNILREYREPLGELISLEMGKIRSEGIGEVQEMIDICDFAVGLSRQLYGLTIASERPAHRMAEQYHPLGTVGVITAFNFPTAVWAWNAAIAVVCGNSVIWKPSELTPLCAVAVNRLAADIANRHNIDGLFGLLCGTGNIGQKLAEDPNVSLISFTGSVSTGKKVAVTVSERLGKMILELGGNNALIVSDKADLDLALKATVFGSVGTAGQRCTTTRRLIIQRSVSEAFTQRLLKAYRSVRIGNPLQEGILMGPLVNRQALDNMQKAIKIALEQGGTLLFGGNPLPDIGPYFAEPAIIKMPAQTDIVKSETFAPILYVIEFDTFEQALHLHNEVRQGLSGALFTRDLQEAELFTSSCGADTGIANINIGTSGAEIGGAFGGEKETGGGREAGSDAWKAYMRRQTNTINRSGDLPLAQGGKMDVVMTLASNPDEINVSDSYGWTSLHWAVESDKPDMLNTLLKANDIKLNIQDKQGRTPLHRAVSVNNIEAVRRIMEAPDLQINKQDHDGYAALHWAILKRLPKMVKLITEYHETDVNLKAKNDWTPLHLAADQGNTEIIAVLVGHAKIKKNIKNKDGLTPLELYQKKKEEIKSYKSEWVTLMEP
ncbi:hypothetical protein CHS0354_030092 [Potamilus streckersoni]|uniref:aldehyde dehydrogenase (NAD(+)) n=1 Tax=Potamilus streckersoni TaxID=2493646 RepID=A0AAE0VGF3_9BIVA|nr:hypothetical protein CHS0354_030092 [Potamilus streckersoni]